MWYDYRCTECDDIFEVQQSIHDKKLTLCTKCNKESLERVIYAPLIFVRPDTTTLGQLADKNAKKLGKYGVQDKDKAFQDEEKAKRDERRRKIAEKMPKGAVLPEEKELPNMIPIETQKKIFGDKTGAKAKKYIETGEV